nr:Chain C, Phosphomimetic RSK1 peptide [Homo sapiens]
RRVRKLPETTL